MNIILKMIKELRGLRVFIVVGIFILGIGTGLLLSKMEKPDYRRGENDNNEVIGGAILNGLQFNIFDFIKQGFQNDKAGIKWTVLAEEKRSGVELVSIKDKMPLHVHKSENHYTYVIAGKGEYTQSGKIISLEPGKFILTPMMIPHEVKNLGEEPLLLLVFSSPKPFDELDIEWIKDKN